MAERITGHTELIGLMAYPIRHSSSPANVPGLTDGLGKFLVFGIIVSIGMSLGGLTGYAINPARDIGPRLAHAVLPIKGKGTSNWGYAVVPLVGPVIGAIVAVLLYGAIPW